MDDYQFLTICPRPLPDDEYYRHYFFQHHFAMPHILKALKGYKYNIYPELTKEHNIHYHVLTDCNLNRNSLKRRRKALLYDLGYFKSIAVYDAQGIADYCIKDLSMMESKLCCKLPIVGE